MSQTPITVGPAVHGRPVGLPEDPHDPIVSEPNLNCGCVSDQVAARPINLGSVQRLQRFADLHQLHVDALLRVLRAQEDLAGAVWDTLRAWRGRGSERPFASTCQTPRASVGVADGLSRPAGESYYPNRTGAERGLAALVRQVRSAERDG